MSEGEFLSELTKRSGCELLLDVNNIVVSGFNLKKDPDELIKDWPFDSVVQFHLAGASLLDEFMIDTHNQSIAEPVWTLFRKALKKIDVFLNPSNQSGSALKRKTSPLLNARSARKRATAAR